MAEVAYRIQPGIPFALTATAKTFLMAIAPAGHGLVLCKIKISFDGITASAIPATVDIVQSTQAGAGTPGTSTAAATITQVRGRSTGGQAPTGGANYTVEPTVLTVVDSFYLPQYETLYLEENSLGREIECDSSGGTIKGLGVRINVTANVNCKGFIEVENL